METFPAFFPLKGRRIVIAGDGEGAEAKARLLRNSPAVVVRLAGPAALDPDAYAGADLIFVASWDAAFRAAAVAAAGTAGAPLNVVDHPDLSDFHTPAIIDRGQIVAAIGSAGAAPLMASLLRAEVETRIAASAGAVAALLGDRRSALREAFPDLAVRRAFLRAVLAGPVAEAAEAGDLGLAGVRLDAAIAGGWSAVGRVSFIAAPVTPDLLSVRAVRALNMADMLVVGAGAGPVIEAHARRDADHRAWGAETESVLALQAREGRLVAVVGLEDRAEVARRLAATGVRVERLEPAPGP